MAMTGAPTKFQVGLRILTPAISCCREAERYSDDVDVSSSVSVFGFVEGRRQDSPTGSVYGGVEETDVFDEEEEGEDPITDLEAKKNFWDSQANLLQMTLYRTTALETGIRNATREALKEIQAAENECKCGKAAPGSDCRVCLMREVSRRLREAGYNCAICRSNWKASLEIPAGQHTYLDVVDNSSPEKGEVRVIIELNFRGEFEMARASEDYNQLMSLLPEVFVGKFERLRNLVKILCSAAKKCMKDKKMHRGPWRKHKYMQAKWSSPCERVEHDDVEAGLVFPKREIKTANTSKLTMALLNVGVPCKVLSVM